MNLQPFGAMALAVLCSAAVRAQPAPAAAMPLPAEAAASAAASAPASPSTTTATTAAAGSNRPQKSLGVVVVTGSRPTSLPTHIPTTIESITGAQVAETINATDAEDALKYFPSLLVRKRYIGDYNHAVLSTRASGTGNSARSMVFADGILLSNLLGNGATFTPRWGLVTPEEIERVDVLYGPFSAAYAGNSVGAVVDYVTRMPRHFEAHAKVGVFAQPFDLYGTHDTYTGRQASASLGNRSGEWAWWFNVNRLDSRGQPLVFATRREADGTAGNGGTPVTGGVPGLNRLNERWTLLGASAQYHTVQDHAKAKLAWDVEPTLRASYTLGYWHNRADGQAETYLRDGSGAPVFTGPVNIDGRQYTLSPADFPLTREGLEHLMHALALKRHGRGEFDWEIAASAYDYNGDLQRRSGPANALPGAAGGGAGTLTDMRGTGWTTLALKGTWRPAAAADRHIVDLGLQQDRFELDAKVYGAADWLASPVSGTPQSVFGGRAQLRSLYAQDTWSFAPRWKAVLGGRLEHWDAWGGITANASGAFLHPERSEHYVSPKGALAYELEPHWVLKASAGRAVRVPTVSELYQGGLDSSGNLRNGDPNLRPEKSWTTEFSSEWDGDRHQLRGTLFLEDTRDALYSQTNVTVTPTVTNIQNVDRVRTRGLELAWQGVDVPADRVDLAASLTYADSRILRNDRFPASVGKRQPRVPQWRANLLATWRPSDPWSLTFGARYSGGQFGTLDNSDVNGFAYQGTSRFYTTDVRAVYRITRQWTAALGIDNLNNHRYWNFHPYPQRTWSAELQFDL
jgi:iron complex outermembrane receptor protein